RAPPRSIGLLVKPKKPGGARCFRDFRLSNRRSQARILGRSLYFIGLKFLYSVSSEQIHGVGRDADRIARRIDAQRGIRRADRSPDVAQERGRSRQGQATK
ncbi:MAG: hypothetical protein LC777_12045, partial [Actinobacteria bacterium]|nr:hypothetical protein [Actinomycetota bacterium]